MNEEYDPTDLGDQEEISKSQIKRELLELQDLAERLAGLKPEIWNKFSFSETMNSALDESRRIKSRNAMRRHIRRLGKLLRKEDVGQVRDLFQRMDNDHLEDTRRFHRLERWRDRLLEEGDSALKELLDECPNADHQHLRQLVRAGVKERLQGKSPAAQRKLFKYLRELSLN
jgi:ribosome-associated protein